MEDRFLTFSTTITELNRYLLRIRVKEMEALGLKSTHVMCLYCLGLRDGMTSTELCNMCKEDKAAVSRSVNELLEKGYVSVKMHDGKRSYRSGISLTEKGRETADYIRARAEAAVDTVGECLTEEERTVFYRSLGLLAEHLEKYMDCDV